MRAHDQLEGDIPRLVGDARTHGPRHLSRRLDRSPREPRERRDHVVDRRILPLDRHARFTTGLARGSLAVGSGVARFRSQPSHGRENLLPFNAVLSGRSIELSDMTLHDEQACTVAHEGTHRARSWRRRRGDGHANDTCEQCQRSQKRMAGWGGGHCSDPPFEKRLPFYERCAEWKRSAPARADGEQEQAVFAYVVRGAEHAAVAVDLHREAEPPCDDPQPEIPRTEHQRQRRDEQELRIAGAKVLELVSQHERASASMKRQRPGGNDDRRAHEADDRRAGVRRHQHPRTVELRLTPARRPSAQATEGAEEHREQQG